MMATDKEMACFISQSAELSDLLSKLTDLISKYTLKWRGNKEKARLQAIAFMNDKGLCGNYEGVKKYLLDNIMMLNLRGDILAPFHRKRY